MPSPRIRRLARERTMQFLFGLDFTKYDWESVIDRFWEVNPSRPSTKKYGNKLIKGVCLNVEEIDAAIVGSLERWTPERVGKIEMSILRMALFELRYCDDVPIKVSINEAIELAKIFGSDDAPRFINGILDRLKEEN